MKVNLNSILLGVDLDHTLFLQVNHLVAYVQKHIDPTFSYEQWHKWDLLEHFPKKRQELIQFFKTYYSSSDNMRLMDGAKEFLRLFSPNNVYYITARSSWLFKDPYQETLALLKENKLPLGTLLLQRNPATNENKGKDELAQDKKLQLFIEDNPENALKISKYCPVLLIDYRFNRQINKPNILRIGQFDDARGLWKINPWIQAKEFVQSGKLMKLLEDNSLSKVL